MKRMIAILLAALMLTGMLTACSGTVGMGDGQAYGNVSTTPNGNVNGSGQYDNGYSGNGYSGNGYSGNGYSGNMGGQSSGRAQRGGSNGSGMTGSGSYTSGAGMIGGR